MALTVVNLGLDFGSTGVRAAYALPGEPVQFAELPDGKHPWLLCEPSDVSPVSFPSIKSKLGGPDASLQDVVTRALTDMREQVESATSSDIGKTVISVPARYSSSQRTALRDAAHAAGLRETRLINDSVAAVIAHTEGSQPGTFLVYGMGYSGFEVGLVRAAARGHYRALGYEGGNAPSGGAVDEAFLGALVSAMEAVPKDDKGWLQLRIYAQWIKEKLAVAQHVAFPLAIAGLKDSTTQVMFERTKVNDILRGHIARTRARVDAVLEQAGLTESDVDSVLLVGGSTRMSLVKELADGLGRPVVQAPHDLIARGAALHADRLSDTRVSVQEERSVAPDEESEFSMPEASRVPSVVLTVPDEPPPAASDGLAQARRLVKDGKREEAAQLLNKIIDEARTMLDDISKPPPPPVSGHLVMARGLLEQGKYEEAVRMSHAAWQQDTARAEVFEAMIDIHCDAAMAETSVDRYNDAQRWLQCAYGHDPSNSRIRDLLGERTYTHASELTRLGQHSEAIRALEHTLSLAPDHQKAQELLQRLRRRSRK